MPSSLLKNLPSPAQLLENPQLKVLLNRVSHNVVVAKVRSMLDDLRAEVQTAAQDFRLPSLSELAQRVALRILQQEEAGLRPVINATGCLLPPGMDHAPLAEEALSALCAIGHDYASDLAAEAATGTTPPQGTMPRIEALLCELTGARAALVVQSQAAAALLTLSALAAGKSCVVSRGQVADLDDGCRLSDLAVAGHARLQEVGTANRTTAEDYQRALSAEPGLVWLAHTSTFAPQGHASQVPLTELAALAQARQWPVVHDLGYGATADLSGFGITSEPVAQQSVAAGADLVIFAGDKLLGGPRCGIVVGRPELVEQLARHPLAAALRIDRLTRVALSATLSLWRDLPTALARLPLLQLLSTSVDNLKQRACRLAPQLAVCAGIAEATARESTACLSHRQMAGQQLPSWCVALRPTAELGLERLATQLRTGTPSVVGHLAGSELLLDLKAVFPRHDLVLVDAVAAVAGPPNGKTGTGGEGVNPA